MNHHCQCESRGFCTRHRMQKGERLFQLCKGAAQTSDCGFKYWTRWEQGAYGAGVVQDEPILTQDWECDSSQVVHFSEPETDKQGLGDRTERILASLGVTQERYVEIKAKFGLPPTCNCTARKTWLNNVGEYLGIG